MPAWKAEEQMQGLWGRHTLPTITMKSVLASVVSILRGSPLGNLGANDQYFVGAAAFASMEGGGTSARIARAAAFAYMEGRGTYARIAGAAAFASTEGRGAYARIAGAAAFASMEGGGAYARIAEAAASKLER